jgi:ABC-type multidrug transport system ATPase subunit
MGHPDPAFAVETVGLRRSFGSITAIDGVSLAVRTGTIFGLLGPNGAGKTTTLRILLGLIRADAGSVRLLGRPLSRDPGLFAQIGAVLDRPAAYPYLSATDNLRIFAAAAGGNARARGSRVRDVLALVGLTQSAHRAVAGFSTGMHQRLALAVALLREPSLLLLDEPTNGLDPAGVAEVRDLLAGLAAQGATILLSSHVLTEVERLCDQLCILRAGKVAAYGSVDDIAGRSTGVRARFGTEAQTQQALRVLARASISARHSERDPLTVEAEASDFGGEQLGRLLAGEGLYPIELRPNRRSLEDAFLDLTRGGE